MTRMMIRVAVVAALAGIGVVGVLEAQAPGGIKRNLLQRTDVPAGAYETVLGAAEIPGNTASIGRHTHFGVEMGTLLEGEATLSVEGQPDRVMKAGDSYLIPAGVPHDAHTGAATAKLIAVYVVEKGKPLATPAPK